jgi:hypothetical protein
MLREHRLELLNSLYPDARDTDKWRGRTIRRSDPFTDLAFDAVGPGKASDHRDVLLGIIIKVELPAVLPGIGYCCAVNSVPPPLCGALPGTKFWFDV